MFILVRCCKHLSSALSPVCYAHCVAAGRREVKAGGLLLACWKLVPELRLVPAEPRRGTAPVCIAGGTWWTVCAHTHPRANVSLAHHKRNPLTRLTVAPAVTAAKKRNGGVRAKSQVLAWFRTLSRKKTQGDMLPITGQCRRRRLRLATRSRWYPTTAP
jgi:hypothetical protein